MIGTNRFVFVHQPKTGGTFVTSVLWKLQSVLETEELKGEGFLFFRPKVKHGTCREIPGSHRDRPILGIVRNPYDRYVSQYEFKWWQRTEYLRYFRRVPGFESRFPSYPDITFSEYLELVNEVFSESRRFDWNSDEGFGHQTAQFLDFYSGRPKRAYQMLVRVPGSFQRARASLFDVHFLRTQGLNEGLYEFLVSKGCPPETVEFVLSLGRILPDGSQRTQDMGWEGYYNEEEKARVRWKERFLFELFPEFDV